MRVSMFRNAFGGEAREVSLERVLEGIRAGTRERQVGALRRMLAAGNRAAYDREKRHLPAFAMSAVCADRRTLVEHSGLVQADLDKLEPGRLAALRERLRGDAHVAAGFLSPSGEGLKLAVRVPADAARHGESFAAVERYFRAVYGVEIDPACKDPLRLCFVSSDPGAWYHPEAVPLAEPASPAAPEAPAASQMAGAAAGAGDYTRNDAGRAERFVARYREDIRFVPERGVWVTWEEGRWRVDHDGAMERRAVALSHEMLAGAAALVAVEENERRLRLGREALECGQLRQIRHYLALAQSERSILLPVERLDADPWTLGAGNAVIDLRTGAARGYGREDYVTRRVAAEAQAGAECPRWRRFVEEIFPDEEVRHYVHKAAGYSLTGDMREQCFFFLHGTGRNGKSKFTETLEHVLGGYALRAGKGIVAARPGSDYPLREMADLAGVRFALASETAEGERLNEGVIKDITGGDSLRAEHKYERSFTFRPQCKLWIAGNHKPTIRGTDTGIWRRVRLIPFTRTFEGAEDDRNLGAKLRAEAPGILRWLVEGCLLWQREGLAPPSTVRSAVEDYRTEEDVLANFIDDCVRMELENLVPHPVLYQTYLDWSQSNGVRHPFGARVLAKRLRDRGWNHTRSREFRCLWRGISLEEA